MKMCSHNQLLDIDYNNFHQSNFEGLHSSAFAPILHFYKSTFSQWNKIPMQFYQGSNLVGVHRVHFKFDVLKPLTLVIVGNYLFEGPWILYMVKYFFL